MARLEDLKPNTSVRGILPDCLVTIISAVCVIKTIGLLRA